MIAEQVPLCLKAEFPNQRMDFDPDFIDRAGHRYQGPKKQVSQNIPKNAHKHGCPKNPVLALINHDLNPLHECLTIGCWFHPPPKCGSLSPPSPLSLSLSSLSYFLNPDADARLVINTNWKNELTNRTESDNKWTNQKAARTLFDTIG